MKKHVKPVRFKALPIDLREAIKRGRAERGWSQRALGAAVRLPQAHISAIESGQVVPRFDTLIDILRLLNLDLLLVPRSLVPAVQNLIRAHNEPESPEKPLYASDEDALPQEKRDENEF